MIMVVVIIGIMAKVAIPRFNIDKYRADAAGRLARMLLQEAQRNAITRQSNVIVSFDPTYNKFRVVQDYNNNDTINTTDLVQYRNMAEGAVFSKPSWTGCGRSGRHRAGGRDQRCRAHDDLRADDDHLPPRRLGQHRSHVVRHDACRCAD